MWRLDADRALVVTADFITPVVDDARTWGRIAAANSVSDVYAMGGRPLLALNLVGWNVDELPTELLGDVLAGAADVGAECGFVTVGGHTVDDPEPKFGLAVVGEVHPDRILTNAGLRHGDVLVLTKPLGVGIIATAIKRDLGTPEVADAAVASMTRSNADACAAALAAGATGATDITGFGLLGHLGRMAEESGVDVVVDAGAVPLLPGARALAETGCVPGGSHRNLDWVRERLDDGGLDETTVILLADAQTSGGLLFGAAPDQATTAVERLIATGHQAAVVGRVDTGTGRLRLFIS
ncbi:selenide, water dikinase SelD [soil metagenome]